MTELRQRLTYGIDVIRRSIMVPGYDRFLDEGHRQICYGLYNDLLSLITTDHIRTISVDDAEAEFHVTNGIEFAVLQSAVMNEHSERKTIKDFLEEIRSDDVVYDIGANIGVYSCLGASKNQKCAIHAFEPVPKNAERLNDNVERNNQGSQVMIHRNAVADKTGKRRFNIERNDVGTVGSSLATEYDDAIEVEVISIDDKIPNELPAPDVVKIDAEGSEFKVLQGMENQLGTVRTIYCELHPILQDDGDSSRIRALLADNGYDIRELERRGDMPLIKATLHPAN